MLDNFIIFDPTCFITELGKLPKAIRWGGFGRMLRADVNAMDWFFRSIPSMTLEITWNNDIQGSVYQLPCLVFCQTGDADSRHIADNLLLCR